MTDAAMPRLALNTLSGGYFVMGITGISVVGLNGPIAEGLGVPPSQVALLMTIFAATYALAAVGLQMSIGDWNRRRLILTGLGLIALGCLLAALSRGFATLAASRMVMALGAALVGPMASATGSALVAPSQRGEALGIVFTGMTISSVLGVPISNWIGEALGWQAAFLAIGAMAVLAGLAIQFVVQGAGHGARTTGADLLRVLGDRHLSLAILVMLFQMAAIFAYYTLIGAYLVQVGGLAPDRLPLILLVFGIGGVIGNQISTRLIRRLGPEPLMLTAMCGIMLLALGLFLLPPQGLLPLAELCLWPVMGFMLMAPQQARLVGMAPDRQNLVLSLNAAALYAGMAAGSLVGAAVFEGLGGRSLPLGTLLLTALALACFLLSRAPQPAVTSSSSST